MPSDREVEAAARALFVFEYSETRAQWEWDHAHPIALGKKLFCARARAALQAAEAVRGE